MLILKNNMTYTDSLIWRGIPASILILAYLLQIRDNAISILSKYALYTISGCLLMYFQIFKNAANSETEFGYYLLPFAVVCFLVPFRFIVFTILYSLSIVMLKFNYIDVPTKYAITYGLVMVGINLLAKRVFQSVEKESIRAHEGRKEGLIKGKEEGEIEGKKIMQYSYSSSIRSVFSSMKSIPQLIKETIEADKPQEWKDKRISAYLNIMQAFHLQ